MNGKWQGRTEIENKLVIPNPMDKDAFPICTVADTSVDELRPFIKSMESVSKSGVHNPLKNVERYLMYGDISRKVCLIYSPNLNKGGVLILHLNIPLYILSYSCFT